MRVGDFIVSPPAPLAGTFPIGQGTFALHVDPDPDGRGVAFRFGFQMRDGLLLHCHSSGVNVPPRAFIDLLRQAVERLDEQAEAAGY